MVTGRFAHKVLQRLSPDNVERLGAVRRGGTAAVRAMRSPLPLIEAPRGFTVVAGQQIRRIARRYDGMSRADQDVAARKLIAVVNDEPRWLLLLEEQIVRSLLGGSALYDIGLGAARFAHAEDYDGAAEVFDRLVATSPSPLAYACAAGVAASGRGDVTAALAHLEAGLERFPEDLHLNTASASSLYRLGHTAQANERLKGLGDRYRAMMTGAFPNVDGLEAEISSVLTSNAVERPKGVFGDRYDEESVESYWLDLIWAMATHRKHSHGFAWLAEFYERSFEGLLARDVATLVNFGVFCAEPDRRAAASHPDRAFVGVDREQSTKRLNDRAFQLPNLSFEASDIRDSLRSIVKGSTGTVAMFHARTTTLMYPEAVKNVYRSCADEGVQYIALFENWALSRSRLTYYEPGDLPQDAVAMHTVMLIHDYRRYLEDAGYRVVEVAYPVYGELVQEAQYAGDAHLYMVAELAT